MSFTQYPDQAQVVELLQRSLERGRLAHAYLFTGGRSIELEDMARTLAKTLNCKEPVRSASGEAIDSCDACVNCRKIEGHNHADVQWIRPESKSRVITVDQTREMMRTVHLKPTEADYKVSIIVAAERMNVQAANAFLKTLEEPPPRSILILLSPDPRQLLETILSRCLRLSFAGEGTVHAEPEEMAWLQEFTQFAAGENKGLLGRYQLLGRLTERLGEMKAAVEETLTARSPLQQHDDVDEKLRKRWEDELKASIEAEYRRSRTEFLGLIQWWLRDIWVRTLAQADELISLPQLAEPVSAIAARVATADALENLDVMERTQRLLIRSNVQEALALEVGLLKLRL